MKHLPVLATIVGFAFISIGCDSSWGIKRDAVTTTPVQDTAALPGYSSGLVGGDQPQSLGQVELTHVHGMGFTADGRQLMVAVHDGLRIFAEGKWQAPNLAAHDYMGFI